MKPHVDKKITSQEQDVSSTPEAGDGPADARRLRFDRVELAGAFGDLGTLLPIVVAMIFINKLSPSSVFLTFGLFYLVSGYYYRLPIPVQPLKAVGAIAIAYPALITESVIGASGIIFSVFLLVFSLSGMIDQLAKLFSQAVVRGIQLTLGLIFLRKGIELIIHKNLFMSGMQGKFPEYPVNLIIGILVFGLVLLLLDNKRFPAALVALVVGIVSGIALGGFAELQFSLGPTAMHLVRPTLGDYWTAAIMLIVPQIPLTIGSLCRHRGDLYQPLYRQYSTCQGQGGKICSLHGTHESSGWIIGSGTHVSRHGRTGGSFSVRGQDRRGTGYDRYLFYRHSPGVGGTGVFPAGNYSPVGIGCPSGICRSGALSAAEKPEDQ